MNDDLIKRADEALDGVTPGPWFTHDGDPALICAADGDDDPWHVANAVWLCAGPDYIIDASEYNANFIAAARQLVPDLRDEVLRLRAVAEENLPDSFWEIAKVVERENKKSVHLRLDPEVFRFFQEVGGGKGHIKRMQDVLESYAKHKEGRG